MIEALSWSQLSEYSIEEPDRVNGPTNAQASLRLFGHPESSVQVTLFRDVHAWCPYCSNNKVLAGFNDLKTKSPGVATEAIGWDPETVLPGSNKRLNWKCKTCGHPWTTTPNKRTKENATGCPECAKKKMGGTKNTIEQMREIAKSRGGRCLSENYVSTHSKLLWQCSEGHTPWEATPAHVKNGTWCPECYQLRRSKN